MSKTLKIDWNLDIEDNARYSVDDDVETVYVSEDQITDGDEIESMREVAASYAATYDHNGNDDGYVVAEIEDLVDGETHRFAFDGNGNFEWDTNRE